MLPQHYHIASWSERQFNFEETWVLILIGPVELKEYGRCARVECLALLDVHVILELVPIKLESRSCQMDLRCSHWSQIGPGNWIQVVCVEEVWAFKDHGWVKVKDLEKEDHVR